jgi:uncharacterized protein YkwD
MGITANERVQPEASLSWRMKFLHGIHNVRDFRWAAAACLALTLLAVTRTAQAQTTDHQPLLRALNELRQQGCDRHPGTATALRENAQLSTAATGIANGRALEGALRAVGYRASRAAQITLNGYNGTAALARGVMDVSCKDMRYGELMEVGLYQRGTQTWLIFAAPFAAPDAAQADDVQAQVLALVNEARARPRQCGKAPFGSASPLRWNATLQSISAAHAADMARYSYFEHTGRDGSHVSDRASRAGYPWRAIGENIAAGQMTADVVVQGWLKSPGHCANIMSTDFSEMGAAFAVNPKSSGGIYWVQVFGTPR